MHASRQLILTALSLVAGGFLWWTFGRGVWYSPQILALLVVQLTIVALPPINRWAARQLDRIRQPGRRARALTALTIAFLGVTYLYLSALEQGRDFFPKFHDEYMHLIQARLLAHGRLWLPSHALPQFFETFHVFVTPVYAPIQFPGTSLLYVPGMWLRLPYWVTPLFIAGTTLALMYLVITHVVDGVAGILAALMLMGVLEFRYQSLMALSNPAALMFGLAILLACLCWRRRPTTPRAMLVGFLGGWALITRPADALCFMLPVALAMTCRAFRGASLAEPQIVRRRVVAMLGATVLAAGPFVALQLGFDHGVTGHWLQTPHALYVSRFHPGLSYFSLGDDPRANPQTTLPQKLDYYQAFVAPAATGYTPATAAREWVAQRLPMIFKASLPSLLLLWLLPVGLLGTTGAKRWALTSIFLLFVVFYTPSKIFAAQYALVNAAAMIPVAIFGVVTLASAVQRAAPRRGPIVGPVGVMFLLTISLTSLPQLNPAGITEQYPAPTLIAAEKLLERIPGRAVVFFKYRRGDNVHEEPAYNVAAADIDSNRVVRAHDLGPVENGKLYEYYRQRQPDRRFYRFDRRRRTLVEIDPRVERDAPMSGDGGSAL